MSTLKKRSAPQTEPFPPDDRDLSEGRQFPDLYDLYRPAHVAGWEPYNLPDLEHAPMDPYYKYPARTKTPERQADDRDNSHRDLS